MATVAAEADRDGDGWVVGADCDDGRADVHPDAAEVCGDLVDQDCDGAVDQGCDSGSPAAEPGGFAWVCGTAPVGAGWLLAALLIAWRSRR